MAVEMVQVPRSDATSAFMIFKIMNNSRIPEVTKLELEKGADKHIEYYFNAIKFGLPDTLSYSLIWKPMNISNDIKKVFLSSSGILHLMNFNLLRTSQGSYLADNQSIVNITNTGNIVNALKQKSAFQSAVLVGVSDFEAWRNDNSNFNSVQNLPGVAKEVYQLDSLLKNEGVATTSILNEQVTEEFFYGLESSSILHLASHGFYDVNNINAMLGSGLLLNKSDSLNDGFLTAYEASLLDLNKTELVVLSACNSGLGEVLEGEGVYGLQRAFEAAGADHIIMSLWKIDDVFTQYFMNSFYHNLMRSKDVSAAFNQTLIQAKNQNEDPRFWGAFKLVKCY
ncbi:MAG: CHAT domain-containing protein [Bacteroidota bacterium]